jgi:TPR repeat protein
LHSVDSIPLSPALANVDSEFGGALMSRPTTDAIFVTATGLMEKGRLGPAFRAFRQAAESGHASSQHNLALCFEMGYGTRRSVEKALEWYKKAWRNDQQTGTCLNIAQLYREEKKPGRALYWLEKALELGDGEAAVELGKYHQTAGGASGRQKSLKYFRKAQKSKRISEESLEEARRLLTA